jgi:hypothetical protein
MFVAVGDKNKLLQLHILGGDANHPGNNAGRPYVGAYAGKPPFPTCEWLEWVLSNTPNEK